MTLVAFQIPTSPGIENSDLLCLQVLKHIWGFYYFISIASFKLIQGLGARGSISFLGEICTNTSWVRKWFPYVCGRFHYCLQLTIPTTLL